MNDDVCVAILAGGQSSRMGRDKSFVELNGEPLIAHVIERVSQLGLPTIIIANQPEAYLTFGLPVFRDVWPNRSSLAGLYSAVSLSSCDYSLCVACDMPFLNIQLLNHLIGLRMGYDAVVPLIGEHPQGLHAIYHNTCLATMRQQIEQNHLKVRDLYPLINTHWVGEDALRQIDSSLNSFVNVNTPEVLANLNADPRLSGKCTS